MNLKFDPHLQHVFSIFLSPFVMRHIPQLIEATAFLKSSVVKPWISALL